MNTSDETEKQDVIIVPPEVAELFDLADESGEYAAMICPDSVKLTSKDGKKIFKEVKWKDALAWGRNALQIISNNSPQ